jgi:hypothetical protein
MPCTIGPQSKLVALRGLIAVLKCEEINRRDEDDVDLSVGVF